MSGMFRSGRGFFSPAGLRSLTYAGSKAYGLYKGYKGSGSGYRRKPRMISKKYRSKFNYGMHNQGALVDFNNKRFDRYFDFEVSESGKNTWQSLCDDDIVNLLGQGTSEDERIGSMYYVTGIFTRIQLQWAKATDTGMSRDVWARLVCVQDRQTNFVIADMDDVFKPIDDNTGADVPILQRMRDLNFTSKYRVLYDKLHKLHAASILEAVASGDSFKTPTASKHVHVNMPFRRPVKVKTTGTGAGVSITQDNSWQWWVCFGSGPNNTVPVGTFSATTFTRLKFRG